jgi:hypothetical protein
MARGRTLVPGAVSAVALIVAAMFAAFWSGHCPFPRELS